MSSQETIKNVSSLTTSSIEVAPGRTFFEVGEEESRLVVLHLPVLDRLPSERVVQLHGLDGSGAPLILQKQHNFIRTRQINRGWSVQLVGRQSEEL